jgi:hypothetical protein
VWRCAGDDDAGVAAARGNEAFVARRVDERDGENVTAAAAAAERREARDAVRRRAAADDGVRGGGGARITRVL